MLHGPKGDLPLVKLKWHYAKSGWGRVRIDRTNEDQPLTLNGQPVSGIGTHADSMIVYAIPEGYETLTTQGALTNHGSIRFAVLLDTGGIDDRNEVGVRFGDIGINGAARVRDLWSRTDLGVFRDGFSQSLPFHGAGLYAITPVK